jgi:hypothetical protein
MDWRRAAAAISSAACVCAGTDLLACGDKFLMLSRGTRFDRAPSARQAAEVLVYAAPASRMTAALNRLSVAAALKRAGYRPLSVDGAEAFEQALRRGGWDLVVVDLADAPAVAARAGGASAPLVVPVALDATREEVTRARTRYVKVIASPAKGQTFVDALDDAMASRLKAQRPGRRAR